MTITLAYAFFTGACIGAAVACSIFSSKYRNLARLVREMQKGTP